jgi:hypothetical protein
MVSALDKAINSALESQAKKMNIDICNSNEVANRMSQTTYESGEMLFRIDNKPVLKLQIQNLTEDVIVFTLEKIKLHKEIIVANKTIMVN